MNYIKYPRTHHLPWSPGVSDDDRVMKDTSSLHGKRIIITKKMDGENTTMYSDHIHARSLDSHGGVDRDWVTKFWSTIAHDIPRDWRICGENLWAKHSIHYSDLPSYFLGFSVWNEDNVCLSWDDTLTYFELLGIKPVTVIWDGIFEVVPFGNIEANMHWDQDEGYVVRNADSFNYIHFNSNMAKYVRKGHVQTTKHWRTGGAFIPNTLKK